MICKLVESGAVAVLCDIMCSVTGTFHSNKIGSYQSLNMTRYDIFV